MHALARASAVHQPSIGALPATCYGLPVSLCNLPAPSRRAGKLLVTSIFHISCFNGWLQLSCSCHSARAAAATQATSQHRHMCWCASVVLLQPAAGVAACSDACCNCLRAGGICGICKSVAGLCAAGTAVLCAFVISCKLHPICSVPDSRSWAKWHIRCTACEPFRMVESSVAACFGGCIHWPLPVHTIIMNWVMLRRLCYMLAGDQAR
jgi:hypothetical protein